MLLVEIRELGQFSSETSQPSGNSRTLGIHLFQVLYNLITYPHRVLLVLGYLAFKINLVIFYVFGFCLFFGKINKDGISSYSSEEIKEIIAAGEMGKIMQQ